jgi:hypothetical protein
LYWDRTRTQPGRLRRWSNALRLRWVFFVSGIGLHLGIAFSLRLGIFPFGCLAFYPVLVWPEEWSALWRKVTRKGPAPATRELPVKTDAETGTGAEIGTETETETETGTAAAAADAAETGTDSGAAAETAAADAADAETGTDAAAETAADKPASST